jgi:DNA-binding transcriptional MocR family regulator
VEDDYDSEFRYAALPIPSLHSLDAGGRVVYVGSFSKVFFPALRIGYLVVPDRVVEIGGAATGMKLTAWLPPGVNDVAMAEAAARAGVDVYPLSRYWLRFPPTERGGFLLGYAGYTPKALQAAAAVLGPVLRQESNPSGGR